MASKEDNSGAIKQLLRNALPFLRQHQDAQDIVKTAELLTETGLSGRELEAYTLLRKGLTNREIAARMGISEKTAKTFLSSVYGKTGKTSGEIIAENNTPAHDSFEELSPTEARVQELVNQGLSNKQIATEMNITVSTVKAHITSISNKKGLTGRTSRRKLIGR